MLTMGHGDHSNIPVPILASILTIPDISRGLNDHAASCHVICWDPLNASEYYSDWAA